MITLNRKQEEARKMAVEWWNSKTKEPFVVLGAAGTGKSSCVASIIESIGIHEDEVTFVAYTGKAASVLTKKGLFATTIHKLIYDPIVDEDTNEVNFILKQSLPSNLKLIVIDEISMVSEKLYNDLIKFDDIRIIALGDPYQLKPVEGKMCELVNKPNIELTEVMRQGKDNPIIYLATKARNKEMIQVGNYGDNCIVVSKDNLYLEYFADSDQIIAGKNITVQKMNNFYRRKILNIETLLPEENEKLICLRNNWNLEVAENGISQPLVNGLTGYITNVKNHNSNLETIKFDFRPDYFTDHNFSNVISDRLYFTDKIKDDNELYNQYDKYKEVLYRRKNYCELTSTQINKFTYGYCITCYKMQGSEVDKLLFINEFLSKDVYWNHLYTGITRAKEKLVLAV